MATAARSECHSSQKGQKNMLITKLVTAVSGLNVRLQAAVVCSVCRGNAKSPYSFIIRFPIANLQPVQQSLNFLLIGHLRMYQVTESSRLARLSVKNS